MCETSAAATIPDFTQQEKQLARILAGLLLPPYEAILFGLSSVVLCAETAATSCLLPCRITFTSQTASTMSAQYVSSPCLIHSNLRTSCPVVTWPTLTASAAVISAGTIFAACALARHAKLGVARAAAWPQPGFTVRLVRARAARCGSRLRSLVNGKQISTLQRSATCCTTLHT